MIRKFRNLEEMNAAQQPKLETDPKRLWQRIRQLYANFEGLIPPPGFRGVHKFRNMEESNQFRLDWMRARAQRMRAAQESRRFPADQTSSQDGSSGAR